MPIKSIPSDRPGRWELLRQLMQDWVRPLGASDSAPPEQVEEAEKRLGVRLPAALRETYTTIGGAHDIVLHQNRLLSPRLLGVEDGHLVFWEESQNVVRWGIPLLDLGSDDPPVAIDRQGLEYEADPRWKRQDLSVSEFVLHMVLHDALLFKQDRLTANGSVNASSLEKCSHQWRRLPLCDWDWPAPPTVFWEAFNCLLVSNGGIWLWLAARDELSFDRAMSELHKEGLTLDRT